MDNPQLPEAGTCRYCRQAVIWVRSARTGTPVPLDPRLLQVMDDTGQVHRGREAHAASCFYRNRRQLDAARADHARHARP